LIEFNSVCILSSNTVLTLVLIVCGAECQQSMDL